VLLLIATATGCSARVEAKAAATPRDSDRDGVREDDGTDKCVGDREDGLPPDRKDGCKSKDPDGDGLAAPADRCPLVPETKNGYQDEDGCPDAKVSVTRMPRVTVTKTEIKIDEKIQFAFGKATIDSSSDGLVKEIAEVMNANPQVESVEVAGHADKVGNDRINVDLTKRRAAAVLDALAALGVDKKRLRAQGYGRYCPLDPADTAEAREANRRVEFKILRLSGKETGVSIGCAAAAAKGIKPAAE
jgi:outer membrane protein OmpA-like peptidoglycan-associated protein